jgi:hypothetical protein
VVAFPVHLPVTGMMARFPNDGEQIDGGELEGWISGHGEL